MGALVTMSKLCSGCPHQDADHAATGCIYSCPCTVPGDHPDEFVDIPEELWPFARNLTRQRAKIKPYLTDIQASDTV